MVTLVPTANIGVCALPKLEDGVINVLVEMLIAAILGLLLVVGFTLVVVIPQD